MADPSIIASLIDSRAEHVENIRKFEMLKAAGADPDVCDYWLRLAQGCITVIDITLSQLIPSSPTGEVQL